ncbi:MAG: flagellar basal-body rod protein FlgG [Phycisphaeraceae bacterium]|nr:flagellar basal-body rod protein FlgG [Phycisphaeraceae bacterium]
MALHSAATGLTAMGREIDIIANNLANANTVGYKAQRANFEDLLYQEQRQPGVENANGDQRPAGLYVGVGTQISNTQFDFAEGSAVPGTGDFDMMISGSGFFRVAIPADQGEGVGYTRAGNFFRNADGDLVLGNSNGPRMEPPINIPEGVTDITISSDGTVSGLTPGATEPEDLGRIELSTFTNLAGLRPIGGNLYVPTAASGPAIDGMATEGVFGQILQKFLESSNVDPVRELVTLIKTQRSFEMNSQSIQAADESLQVVSNLRR